MIVRWNHLRFQINQTAEYTVQCNRICGHQQYIHRNRISRTRSVALHGHNPIHHIQLRCHTFIQINKHSGKAVCTRVLRVPLRFMESIYKPIAVLNRTGDTF